MLKKIICLSCSLLTLCLFAGCGEEEIVVVQGDIAAWTLNGESTRAEEAFVSTEAGTAAVVNTIYTAGVASTVKASVPSAAAATSRTTTTTTTKSTTTTTTAVAVPTTNIPEKTQRQDYNVRIVGPLTVKVGEQIQLRAEVTDQAGVAVDVPLSWSADTIKQVQLLFDGQERNIYVGEVATYRGKTPGEAPCGVRCFDGETGTALATKSFTIVVTE